MTRDEYESSLYLAHHGIKGQKWGIRRYQNEDGSYTDAGKKRRRDDESDSSDLESKKKGLSDGTKKALKAGAIVAGTALALYGAYKLSEATDLPSKIGEAKERINGEIWRVKNSNTGKMVGEAIDKINSSKAKKFVGETVHDAGKAMATAALATAGTIAISKIDKKYADNENDSDSVRYQNAMKRNTLDAGVSAATNGRRSSGNSNQSGTSISSDMRAKAGDPKRNHPWNGDYEKRYADLMGQYRQDTPENQRIKMQIRSMRKADYSIDQIEKYIKS